VPVCLPSQQLATVSSQFFPVCERRQFVQDFLQSLKPTFVISRCARYLLSGFDVPHVQTVRFTNLRDLLSQLYDALFDGILHDDRLAAYTGRILCRN
jgi:hypothetical protein